MKPRLPRSNGLRIPDIDFRFYRHIGHAKFTQGFVAIRSFKVDELPLKLVYFQKLCHVVSLRY